jgi:hypothetical protein
MRPNHGLWNPKWRGSEGWIAEPTTERSSHRWGGERWRIVDPVPIGSGPGLLLTIDGSDERIARVMGGRREPLPLASYTDCDVWVAPQDYIVDRKCAACRLVRRVDSYATAPAAVEISPPLPEHRLRLRPMLDEEVPWSADSYSTAADSFLGRGFIRIGGPPLWLQGAADETCDCGQLMNYVASVGYQSGPDAGLGLAHGGAPFFIGESGLYFFYCAACDRFRVTAQST